FLEQYRFAVDTAERLGFNMCLYDEYWFPSGAAGGLLEKNAPEALSKRLDLKVLEVQGPTAVQTVVPDGVLMSAVAMQADTLERVLLTPFITNEQLQWQAPAGPWRIMLFSCVRDGNRGLVDYLDPEAVQQFIALTYDKYYEALQPHFGKTIDSAFYDEPTMHWIEGGRAWTPAFNAKFQARHGYDPALLYPALWYDIGDDTAAARNALFGFRAELYAEGFIKTIQDWCTAHGIQLTGHQDQEEIVNPVGLCGDLILSFRYQDIPGIDQIFAYGRASKAYKVVSSAAYNYDQALVMTECYGAMDKMPISTLYKEAMDQFTKGINWMVPHAVWYDPVHITFPPELSYRTEAYGPALPAYNEYMGRLQRLLQPHGRHVADIAVLYPIATMQAGYRFGVGTPYTGGIIPPEADYMDVGEMLSLGVRRDFTYLHPTTLAENAEIEGREIVLQNKINRERFSVLLLPGSQTIAWETLQFARNFYEQGGVVIATTQLPDQSAEFGKGAAVREAIAAIFGQPTAQETGPRVSASSSWAGGGYDPALAVDGNRETRWNTAAQSGGNQWFEMAFDSEKTIATVVLHETFNRTTSFRIQTWDGEAWVECAKGGTIGHEKQIPIPSIKTTKIRLLIDSINSDCVSFDEIEVLDPQGKNLALAPVIIPQARLHASGGKSYFIPRPTAEVLQTVLDDALPGYDVAFADPLTVEGGNLSYIHKIVDGRDIYFFGNSSETPVDCTVWLRGEKQGESWNPHTGAIQAAVTETEQRPDGAYTALRLVLPPVESRFFVTNPGTPSSIPAETN
ncbi:MAG: glycosyl hydrolase, partial [bacterium]|nr:glycosyl hydrolase [bacterium]